MSISGGGDRSELRPLRPDGSVDHDMADHVVVGNHKGQYAGFNVVDPRPGTVHQYGTRRDVLSARQRGWWVADPERDGHPAYDMAELYHSDLATPLTRGDTPYPEYVHLVTTEENYRRLMEEQLERNREQLAPAGYGRHHPVPGRRHGDPGADALSGRQSDGLNLTRRLQTRNPAQGRVS